MTGPNKHRKDYVVAKHENPQLNGPGGDSAQGALGQLVDVVEYTVGE